MNGDPVPLAEEKRSGFGIPPCGLTPCKCGRGCGAIPAQTVKRRGEWSWKRLWCWLDGHGGIAWDDGVPASNAARPYCKRCGAKVRLIA